MSLTGTAFAVLVGAAALTGLGAVVLAAPRLSGRTVARAGALLASQVLLMAALLTLANDYFAFYGSWGELVGAPAGSGANALGSRAARAVTRDETEPPLVADPGDAFVRQHQVPVADGRLEAVVIHGQRSGISAKAYVYLPSQYLWDRRRRFPVGLALTGYPGNAENLITRLKLPEIAAREIAAGHARPMIFVMMRPMVTPPRDTECTDVPGGPQALTFFAEDLPAAIRSAYRVVPGPAGWSALGDSTGGYCALKLAMLHSDRFGAAVSLAGYYKALKDFTTGDLYGGSKAYRAENDLAWRLRHLPPPPIDVLVATSRKGERDYPATRAFLRLVRPPMRSAAIILPSGGHHFSVWQRELIPALRWLSDRAGS